MASSITHFTHPTHRLIRTEGPGNGGEYRCDLCRTLGSGLHYRCHSCDFDLHEHCADLPDTISFFAHPWHNLHLQQGTGSRICDLCTEPVEGFYYRCITCSFDVHPHCTKTQQTVHTELHPEHNLYLAPAFNLCTACKSFDGNIWLYRCGMCNVNLHMRCLHGAVVKPKEHHHHHHGRLSHFLREVGNETAVKATADVLLKLFMPSAS